MCESTSNESKLKWSRQRGLARHWRKVESKPRYVMEVIEVRVV